MPLRLALVLVAAATVAVPWLTSGPVAAGSEPVDAATVERGGAVFHGTCAACHGTSGAGAPSAGDLAGPAIDDIDVARVELALRTGRMPIPSPRLGVVTDRLDPQDRAAVVAWMRETFDLPGEVPTVTGGDARRGMEPFVRHCAACHGAAGIGGVAGGEAFAPSLDGLDPVVIAAAARAGPDEMPAFSPAVLADDDLADVAAYLDAVDRAPRTAVGLRELTQVGVAVAVLALVAAAALVTRRVAARVRDDVDEVLP